MEASVSSCTAPSLPSLFLRRKVLWTTRTGFIITDDGDIITNAQVVQGGCRVQVELKSGDRFDATIRRVDEEVNIALIHINSSMKLPILRLCTSTAVRSGQSVLAFGNSPSMNGTVTMGIVSGRRSLRGNMIQHSAVITGGFLGGHLLLW
ncbi:serine protease HTRA1A-like isoform X1 [Oryzias latipes]